MKTNIIIILLLSNFCWVVTSAQTQKPIKIIIGKSPPQKVVETTFSISKFGSAVEASGKGDVSKDSFYTSRIYKCVDIHKVENNKTYVLTYTLEVRQNYTLNDGYCRIKADSIYSVINIKRITNSEVEVKPGDTVMANDNIQLLRYVRKEDTLFKNDANNIMLSSIRMLSGIQKTRELRWNRTFQTFTLRNRPYLRASIHSGPLASYRFVQVYSNNITDGKLMQSRNEADYSRFGWVSDIGFGIQTSPVSAVSIEGIWGSHGYDTRDGAVDNSTGHFSQGSDKGNRFQYMGFGLSYNYDGIGSIVNFSGTVGLYSTWLTQYKSGTDSYTTNDELKAANLRLHNWMLKAGMGINLSWNYHFAFQVMPVTYFNFQSADYATDLRSFLYDFGLQVGFVGRIPTFTSK